MPLSIYMWMSKGWDMKSENFLLYVPSAKDICRYTMIGYYLFNTIISLKSMKVVVLGLDDKKN